MYRKRVHAALCARIRALAGAFDCGLVPALALALACALAAAACGDSGGSPGTTGFIEGSVTLAGATDHSGVIVVVNETGDVATTAPSGRYRLTGIAPGLVTLTASKTGYVSATSGTLSIAMGKTTDASPMELVQVRGVITGTARKEGETDQSGIVVRLLGTMEEVVTSADGAFTFASVGVGTQMVEAQALGFEPERSAPLQVVGDEPVDAGTLVLAKSRGDLEGMATLEGETDHSGILVSLQGTSHATLTGPSGAYSFGGVPVGQYTVVATRSGFAQASVADQTVAAGQTTAAPALVLATNPGTVTGHVALEGGGDPTGTSVSLVGTAITAVVTSDGTFLMSNVPAGAYVAQATRSGFDPAQSPAFAVAPGGTADLGMLTLFVSRGSLTGSATLEGESDHSGILVSLQGTGYATLSGTTGTYSFSGVTMGQYTVVATKVGYSPAVVADQEVLAGQITTVPPLLLSQNPGTVTGHVALEGGGDPTGTIVTIVGTGITAVASADGAFTLGGVPAGTYMAQATRSGFDPALSAPFALAPGGSVDLGTMTLIASRGGLAGTATLEGESSHSGILIELQGSGYATFTGPTGAYSFSGVPAGQYTVVATKTGFALATATDQAVLANQITSVPPLVLATNPGTVTGVVALEGGGDPTGATVTLVGTGITAVAGPTGAFNLGGVPAGNYMAQVTLAGFDPVQSAAFSLAPGATYDLGTLTLFASRGSLAGTATLAGETDHSGILISLQGTSFATITGPTGAYAFNSVPCGQYTVVATRTGFAQASATDQAVLANQITNVPALVLATNPGTVTGVVALEGGGDPTGASVTLVGTGITAVAAADGAFTLTSVPSGTYVVQATLAGYNAAQSAPFVLAPGATYDIGTLTLSVARGGLTGTALLDGETDHSGILVSLLGTGYATLTGPTGAYSFSGVPVGQYTVVATKTGFAQASATDQAVLANQITNVPALVLATNPGTVTGVVALEGGGDPTGATVTLVGTGITAVAGPTGAFTLSSVPTGTYVVQATLAGYNAAQSAPFTLAPGATHDAGTITLSVARGNLAGTATLAGETNHSGILVELQGSGYATFTGASGAYSFSAVPVGQYTVVATKTGFAQATATDQAVLANQTTNVPALVLATNPGTVTGIVALEGGGDPTGATVTLVGTGITAVVDPTGAFTLSSVPTGTYVVQATLAGYNAAQSAPFTLAPGATHDAGTITLGIARGSLAGTATLDGETDHSSILVSLQGTSFATLTGPTGAYSFSGVPVGQYTVVATRTGFAQASATDQAVLANQTTNVPALVLARNPGTVTGIVRYEDRTDHTGILVTLNNSPYSGSTNATGRFTITDVAEAPYSASAQAAGYARYDFPLVVVKAGQTTDLGENTLVRLKGRIEGVVELQGMSSHGGVKVELLGTSYFTYSGLDGRWSLEVPVGNYPLGVRATYPHWSDAAHEATITVTESGVASVPLLQLLPLSNQVNGKVLLFNQPTHEGVTVELFGVDGTDTEGLHYSLVTTDPAGTFSFPSVAIGPYDISYHKLPAWPTLRRFAEVLPGDPLELPTETLQNRLVRINDDAPATRWHAVTLTLASSDCFQMRVGNQADLSGEPWMACAPAYPWTLPGPDGWAYVYAQFMDSLFDVSEVVYDRIWLDSTAVVSSVTEDTAGQPKKRGESIRFTLDAGGEAGGVANIDVAGYLSGIPLYDDGTHGDAVAGDGIYATDHVIEGSTDVQNALVTGHFTDKYGNTASGVAPGTVTLANPPRILNIRVIPDSATLTATISWETDELASGRLDWGLDAFYGNVEEDTNPTTSKSFTLTGLSQGTPYHFRITATDLQSNFSMTVDRVFYLRPNPPEKVIGLPGDGRFDVRWEAPPQENVVGYHVYRSVDGGPRIKLTATPYTHEALVFYDEGVPNGTPREYWVTAVDEFGNESEDAPSVSGTPDAPPPAGTNVSGVLTGTTVWTTKGGPYNVTGNILVPSDGLLVVGPGTQVRVNGADTYIRVDGQFVSLGAELHPVAFTSAQPIPTPGDWMGIRITDSAATGRYDWPLRGYLSGNLFYRTVVEYSGKIAIRFQSSDVLISNSIIRHNTNLVSEWLLNERVTVGGIFAMYSNVTVTDSRFEDNEVFGDMFAAGAMLVGESDLTLVRSYIQGNSIDGGCGRAGVAGIAAINGSNAIIIDTLFQDNTAIGSPSSIVIWESDGTIVSSLFSGNTSDSVGTIFAHGSMSNLSILDCRFVDNLSTSAGGQSSWISLFNPSGTIMGCYIEGSEIPDLPMVHSAIESMVASYNHFVSMGANETVWHRWQDSTALVLYANSMLTSPASHIVRGGMTATNNYWGPLTTAEMDSLGPDTNIPSIWDYWDDFELGKVVYDSWAHGAFPLARIDTPRWGRRFKQGQTISFTGHADDPEDGAIPSGSLSWSSSIDGPLGTGAALDWSTLSVGHHQIWLTATDSGGQEGKIYVELDVVE